MFNKKKKKTSQFSTYRKSGGLWQWVLAGVVMVCFAVLVGYAYMQKDALDAEILNPTLITAQTTPIKTRAENPGGLDIPNQDKQVFDLLKRVGKKEIDAHIKVKDQDNPTIIQDIVSPEKQKIAVPQIQEPIKKPVYAPANKVNGEWGVQLASFSNFQDAKNGLAKFNTKYFSLLNSLEPDLQRASVKGETYYRSRFIGLATREDALNVCRSLKQQNQGCLAVKK